MTFGHSIASDGRSPARVDRDEFADAGAPNANQRGVELTLARGETSILERRRGRTAAEQYHAAAVTTATVVGSHTFDALRVD